jgi:predicted nucleic acid-binding protein
VGHLIDTNVLSEIRKGPRCDANVQCWWASVAHADLFLSVLTIGEIRCGIERIHRRDPAAAAVLETWLRRIESDYAPRLLPITTQIADMWGRLNSANPIPQIDGLLAATALVHGLIVVSRNTKHFSGLGVQVLNPFEPTP